MLISVVIPCYYSEKTIRKVVELVMAEFEKNKGYGTKAHYEGLGLQGICPIHRRTFLKGKSYPSQE
mgnify:CR=1 FL=1